VGQGFDSLSLLVVVAQWIEQQKHVGSTPTSLVTKNGEIGKRKALRMLLTEAHHFFKKVKSKAKVICQLS
jgi:hypothetical protein